MSQILWSLELLKSFLFIESTEDFERFGGSYPDLVDINMLIGASAKRIADPRSSKVAQAIDIQTASASSLEI